MVNPPTRNQGPPRRQPQTPARRGPPQAPSRQAPPARQPAPRQGGFAIGRQPQQIPARTRTAGPNARAGYNVGRQIRREAAPVEEETYEEGEFLEEEEAPAEEEAYEEDPSQMGGPTGRGLGRGQGRLPKTYDYDTVVVEMIALDPNGRNKYSTVPPGFRDAMARLGAALQLASQETQEEVASLWEQVVPEEVEEGQ